MWSRHITTPTTLLILQLWLLTTRRYPLHRTNQPSCSQRHISFFFCPLCVCKSVKGVAVFVVVGVQTTINRCISVMCCCRVGFSTKNTYAVVAIVPTIPTNECVFHLTSYNMLKTSNNTSSVRHASLSQPATHFGQLTSLHCQSTMVEGSKRKKFHDKDKYYRRE